MRGVALCAVMLVLGCGRQEVFRFGQDSGPTAGATDSGNTVSDADPIARTDGPPGGFDGGPSRFDGGPFPRFDGGPPPPPDGGPPRFDGGPFPRFDGGPPPRRDGGPQRPDRGPPPPPDAGPRPVDASAPDTSVPIDGGVSTDAGAPGCTSDMDCAFGGASGFCEPTSQQCVECLQDNHCGRLQVCDTANGFECRLQCFAGRCPPNQVCDPASDTCVACINDMDCGGGRVCSATRQCVECTIDSHCAGQVGRPYCGGNSECVGCRSDADCTAPATCDSQRRECLAAAGRGLCEPCEMDGQCGGSNDFCLGFRFGPNQFVDRACAQDCSNTPCPQGYECIDTRGNSARQCRPTYPMRNPTCEAVRHLGEPCQQTSTDPGCGLSNFQDARCDTSPAGNLVCTYWCDTDDDCASGTTCHGATQQDPGFCF